MMKIFNESGKGYWMEGFGCLRAEGENRQSRPNHLICFGWGNSSSQNLSESETVSPTIKATRSGEPAIVVLNDQGGSVMDISDKAGCLRAQEHGHPPVICGLTNRGYDSGEVAETLRAESHNALPIVAYCFEPGIAKRDGSDGRFVKNKCGTLRAEMGDNQPAVCYAVYPGVSITSANDGSNPQPGDPCPTLVNDSRYYLVGVRENDR